MEERRQINREEYIAKSVTGGECHRDGMVGHKSLHKGHKANEKVFLCDHRVTTACYYDFRN